jgi:hypothetical protein
VYTIVQRPLSGGVDPARLARIGEYDVDANTWSWYFYPMDADLAGARNVIVLSELTHLGGDELAVIERDQRRTGSASIKRIYRFSLSTGTRNDSANPVDKVLAVDLLSTPFRFDFEKVETLAITPRGTFVVNDNDGGDEGTFFYRLVMPLGDVGASGGGGGGEAGSGGSGGGGADGSGGSGGGGSSASLVINEVRSNPNPDSIEFYNPGPDPVNVSGWYFTDNDSTHVYTFPTGTTIAGGARLVLVGDTDFNFGLGGGDSVILYNSTGALVDEVTWSSHVNSLGRCPDGAGSFVPMTPSFGAANICL